MPDTALNLCFQYEECVIILPIFILEKTEAPRGYVTFLHSPSLEVTGLGFTSSHFSSRLHVLNNE